MPGIEKTTELLKNGIELINAVEKLRGADFSLILDEMWDIDELEANKLATDLQLLDLTNDELEMKIETAAMAGAKPLAFALRILKLFIKKPAV